MGIVGFGEVTKGYIMSIELTPQTVELLKNFATINSNILLEPGQKLQTISPGKNIVAQAKIEEDFGVEFGVWDLPGFLAIVSSFETPVLDFADETNDDGTTKFVIISEKDGKGRFKYFGSPKNVLTILTKEFKMPPPVVEFDMSKNVLQRCMKTAAMAQLPNLVVQSMGGKGIDIVITDDKIESSNEFRIPVSEDKVKDAFHLVFDSGNLKMLLDSYRVSMDGKIVSRFQNEQRGLTYYVANEKTSRYGE